MNGQSGSKPAARTASNREAREYARLSERFKFKPTSLADDIADHIAMLLATNKLEAGQRVYEKDLADLLGISRVPIREAMRLLQAQGVVHIEPNRGAFLATFGPDEIQDMLNIRVGIEQSAIRRVLNRPEILPGLITDLRASVEEMRRAVLLADRLAHCQADIAFHRKIVRAAGSPLLAPLWEMLSRVVLIFLMRERDWNAKPDEGVPDHEALITLIKDGCAQTLNARIETHIVQFYKDKKH